MSVLVGVDAGASHTEAVAGDESLQALARQQGPPGAVQPGEPQSAADVIARAVRGALEAAKIGRYAHAVVVGAAGAGQEPERAALEAALADRLHAGTKLKVTTDAHIALRAAFQDSCGIVLIAGSGSIAYGRDPAGRSWRVGGLGWQFGDEGSGYALARGALGMVGRAADGRCASTSLSERLAVAVGAQSFDELVRWTRTADHTAVAALARDVCDAAREGDQAAQELVRDAARELAAHIGVLLRRFPTEERVRLALSGGLLSADSPVRTALIEIVKSEMPAVEVVEAAVDPPVGALALAARLLAQ